MKQTNTWLLLTFCCWAVRRMEAGRGRGAETETVFGAYVGRIVGRHNRKWCRKPEFDQSVLNRVHCSLKKARLVRLGPRPRHRRLAIVAYHFNRFTKPPGSTGQATSGPSSTRFKALPPKAGSGSESCFERSALSTSESTTHVRISCGGARARTLSFRPKRWFSPD